MRHETLLLPHQTYPSDASIGHEEIDVYALAIRRGEAVGPVTWLRGRSPGASPGPKAIAALAAIDLLVRHRSSKPVALAMSDLSTPVRTQSRSGRPLFDDDWFRAQGLQWLGYLDVEGGGMGQVGLAWYPQFEREVILKVASDSRFESRFRREIAVHGKLSGNAHIAVARMAPVYKGASVLVIDHVPGPNLRRAVQANGPMPWREACRCIRQAALGLSHAHNEGIVHRDVKPSNLVRSTRNGVVSVIDWGLAIDAESRLKGDRDLTLPGVALGTPEYCAPEQTRDASTATPSSDLYGLGCAWHELLTGRPPFSVGRELQPAAHAKSAVAPLAPELGVPEAVEHALRRLLEKDPERRHASAEALIADLERALNPPGPRWPRVVAAVAAVVVLGLGVRFLVPPMNATPSSPTVRDLIVKIADPRGRPEWTGTLGSTRFEAAEGDELILQADLSGPAYSYLIAFRPDGRVELCSPSDPATRPVLDASPSYPSNDARLFYGLHEGAGLQAFAVISSRHPLPPFRDLTASAGPPPWHAVKVDKPGVVWRSDGGAVKPLTADDPSPKDRSTGFMSGGPQGTVGELANWLKSLPGVEAVAIKAFAVVPKRP